MAKKSFLKRGKEARKAIQVEKQQEEIRKEAQNKLWRFFIKEGESTKITFLTGDLDEDVILNIPTYHEHRVYMNGNWNNFFVCPKSEDTNADCPICNSDNHASLSGVLLVIDHSSYTGKDGKVYENQLKLFVCKRSTIDQLNRQAIKHGGLVGARFEVSRFGDKSYSVGTEFEFVKKFPLDKLMKKYDIEELPDLEDQLPYVPVEKLKEMGFDRKEMSGGKAIDEDDM